MRAGAKVGSLWTLTKAWNSEMVDAAARPIDDWYRTPPECTRALLSVESFPGGVHDPFAGDGMMSAVLAEQLGDVVASTLYQPPTPMLYPVQIGADFFELPRLMRPHAVGNCPYGKLDGKVDRRAAEKVIARAIELQEERGPEAGKIVLILDVRFLAGMGRRDSLWAKYPPARVWAFSDRVTMYPGAWEDDREPGTQFFGWFTWERPFLRPGEHPIVRTVLDSRAFRHTADWERYGYKPAKSTRRRRADAVTMAAE